MQALKSLQVGWDGSAWTFPERDATGNVIGILRRFANGKKSCVKGSKRGLTFSENWNKAKGPIFLVEGPSDTAAGMTLRLSIIGHPTARGGYEFLTDLLRDVAEDRQIIVIGEHDKKDNGDWPGRDGAIATAEKLAVSLDRPVDWALPPDDAKDLREWLNENGKDSGRFVLGLEIETIDPTAQGTSTEDQDSCNGSQASRLVRLVNESGAELFHSPDEEAFVTMAVENHKLTHRIRGDMFQRWLGKLSWERSKRAISSQVLEQVTGTLIGLALYEGETIETFVRIAGRLGDIWIDLVDNEWRAVKVTPNGWEVVTNPPVRFIRNKGMRPLPVPLHGGGLSELREFLNVSADTDWILLQAWLVGCFRPTGPYPRLALHGEQGSAKSTTSRMLRALIDPNKSPVRSTPTDGRDLMITVSNSWLVGFDNLSHIKEWLSDALCRLLTGGGLSTRTLYSDDGEKIFDVQRPVLMNGITELAKRPDLLDRTISVILPSISEAQRKTESDLWEQFNAACPRIFGAVLTAVSTAILNEPDVQLERTPRLADFTRWVVAAEPALDCATDDVMATLAENRTLASETAIDVSVIGEPLLRLLVKKEGFKGSATELLEKLNSMQKTSESRHLPRGWPQQPNSLSTQLRRLVPNLRAVGWDVVLDERDPDTRTKIIDIHRLNPPFKKRKVKGVGLKKNLEENKTRFHDLNDGFS